MADGDCFDGEAWGPGPMDHDTQLGRKVRRNARKMALRWERDRGLLFGAGLISSRKSLPLSDYRRLVAPRAWASSVKLFAGKESESTWTLHTLLRDRINRCLRPLRWCWWFTSSRPWPVFRKRELGWSPKRPRHTMPSNPVKSHPVKSHTVKSHTVKKRPVIKEASANIPSCGW